MQSEMPDLPPLWSVPAPMGHNGGPPLAPRPPGRPTISTPEMRDRILELLWDGIPLRVICRTAGMPGRQTIYRWRHADPAFDLSFKSCQTEGYIQLMEQVIEEVERILDKRGPKMARLVFNWRRQQLSRMNPAFFGDRAMKC